MHLTHEIYDKLVRVRDRRKDDTSMYIKIYFLILDNFNSFNVHTRDVRKLKNVFFLQSYLLTIGKKQNMQVLSHTFTYFST